MAGEKKRKDTLRVCERTYNPLCVCIYTCMCVCILLDMHNMCPLESIFRCVCVRIPIVCGYLYSLCVCTNTHSVCVCVCTGSVCMTCVLLRVFEIYMFALHEVYALESFPYTHCTS